MVLLSSLVAFVALLNPQSDDSLLAKLVHSPTGKNGYEDYLRAGDIAGSELWGKYETWIAYQRQLVRSASRGPEDQPEMPEVPLGVTPGMSELSVRKVANDRLGGVCAVIELGNRKPVSDPRPSYSMSTPVPELGRFKMLAKIYANRAHVEFADGRSGLAVKDLIEGMKFGRGLFGSTVISSMVSIAIQAIMLAEFQEHLGQLSLTDAQLIQKYCRATLNTPLPMGEVLKREFDAVTGSLDEIIDHPSVALNEDLNKEFGPALSSLGSAERQKLKGLVTNSMHERYAEMAFKLTSSASTWPLNDASTDPIIRKEDHSVSNLALLLVTELYGKDQQRQYTRALARIQIQLRLLMLHGKLIDYHWQHNRWPLNIEEFADPFSAMDPFSGEPFHYEFKEGSYRLFSIGIPGLGPIELKYRPLPNLQQAGAIRPPA